MRIFVVAIIASSGASTAFADTPNAQELCFEALKDIEPETSEFADLSSMKTTLRETICDERAGSADRRKNVGFVIPTQYGPIDLKGGSADSETSRKKYCSDKNSTLDTNMFILSRKVNPESKVRALAICAGMAPPAAKVEYGWAANQVTVTLRKTVPGPMAISGISDIGSKCKVPSALKTLHGAGDTLTFTCPYDQSTGVGGVIETDGGSFPFSVVRTESFKAVVDNVVKTGGHANQCVQMCYGYKVRDAKGNKGCSKAVSVSVKETDLELGGEYKFSCKPDCKHLTHGKVTLNNDARTASVVWRSRRKQAEVCLQATEYKKSQEVSKFTVEIGPFDTSIPDGVSKLVDKLGNIISIHDEERFIKTGNKYRLRH